MKETRQRISHLLANPCITWQDPDSRFFLHHVSSLQCLPGKGESQREADEISSALAASKAGADPQLQRGIEPPRPGRVGLGNSPVAGLGQRQHREAETRPTALARDTGLVLGTALQPAALSAVRCWEQPAFSHLRQGR